MKNSLSFILICFTFTISAQSYFNEAGQSSNGLSLQYAPDEVVDQTLLQYIVSVKGRLDLSPTISYGGSSLTSRVFSAGLGADYFVLKQRSSLPLSLSVGARFNHVRISSFGFGGNTNFGSLQSKVYHQIRNETIYIVPSIGYVHSYQLDDTDFNGGYVEIAAAFGVELKNGNIVSLTPAIQFPEGDTQFIIGLGYNFARAPMIENN